MREAIGNTFLTSLATVFLFVIMSLLVSALVYSKAYKAKNKIISVIEKYNGFTTAAQAEADSDLFKMGYKTNATNRSCSKIENTILIHDSASGRYDYCVYQINSTRGEYYKVITYTHLDLPIIGQYLTFQVKGDSRTIYKNLEG